MEEKMLSEAREEIVKAHQKALGILATEGIGFGAVAGGLLAAKWSVSNLGGLRLWTWWIGVVLAFPSVLICAAVIWPRYKKPDPSKGITYWGHVVYFESYELFFAAMDKPINKETNRTRDQLWAISNIVKKKFQLIRWSLSVAAVALRFLLFTALWNAQKK